MEIKRSCLDCKFSNESSSNETLVCSKLTPGWVRETNHYGDILRQIPANQPYINCPAWEKEAEDGS